MDKARNVEPIEHNWVYLESRDGATLAGNVLRIAQRLSRGDYRSFKLLIFAAKKHKSEVEALVDNYALNNAEIISDRTEATALMERVKYIVTDSGMPWEYVKRPGQVVLNTWHGTPLKHMGKRVKSIRHALGTVQHLFLSTDYFVSPSDYLYRTMLSDYMVDGLMGGKVLLEGYPRNEVFFDMGLREEVRAALGFSGKRVTAYMPTWRSGSEYPESTDPTIELLRVLYEIDAYLGEEDMFLFKAHPRLGGRIDFSRFEHVQPFPGGRETYEVLCGVDCLVTDYSSVMIDFANTRRKVVLFPYDLSYYQADRGMYFDLDDLPFPVVHNVQRLLDEVAAPKAYDDAAFLREFCTYDGAGSTERICRHVFLGERLCREISIGVDKKRGLVFAGRFRNADEAHNFSEFIEGIAKSCEADWYVSFRRKDLEEDPSMIDLLPEGVSYLPLFGEYDVAGIEHEIDELLDGDFNAIFECNLPPLLKKVFRREWQRLYSGVRFDCVVNYEGHMNEEAILFANADCPSICFREANGLFRSVERSKTKQGC